MTDDFIYTGKEELFQGRFLPGYNRNIARQLMKVVKPGQALMDLGAGIGTISELVRERAEAEKIICLEIDADNIAELKEKGFDVINNIEELPDKALDTVYSSNVLEHIEDDLGILKALYRKLKPGGYISFYVPALQILWTGMDDRVGHFRRYHRAEIIDKCRDAGFEVECCYYQDCLGVLVTMLFKLVGNKDGTVSEASLKLYDRAVFPVSHVMDFVCSRFIGKNLVVHARKPY